MKITKRKWAFAIGVVAMIGMFFWMRALASWRPQLVAKVPGRKRAVPLEVSPDGRFLLAGLSSASSFRAIYDLQNKKWAPRVPHPETFQGFAPGGTYFSSQDLLGKALIFATPDDANRARILRREVATGKVVWSALDSHFQTKNFTLATALSSDEKQVWVRASSNLKAFDARSGKMLWRRALPRVNLCRFARGAELLWGGVGDEAFLSEAESGRILWRKPKSVWVWSSGVSPDQSLIWIVSDKDASGPSIQARFHDLRSGKLLWTRPLDAAPNEMLFSRDGRIVAFQSASGVEWFEARSGQSLGSRAAPGLSNAVKMAFAPDGNSLYTSDNAGQIWKWRFK